MPIIPTPLLLALSAALVSVSAFGGWKLRDSDYQRHLAAEARAAGGADLAARTDEHKAEAAATASRTLADAGKAQAEIVYRTVTKEVPTYVTQTPAAQAVVSAGGLPAGFVWGYNQSVTAALDPLPPGLSPSAPTGIDMSTLAEVTAGNLAVCRTYRSEALGWRDWYARVAALYNQPEKMAGQ